MATVEERALALGIHDLAAFLPPVAESELQKRLQSLAQQNCRRLISQARAADPLIFEELSCRRSTQQLQTELAASLGALQQGAALNLPHLTELSSQIASLQTEHDQLQERRLAYYRRSLHRQLPRLAADLATAAQDYQEAERRLKDFFGTTKGLWDLEAGQWQSIKWGDLASAAAFAREWPEIQELAHRLGRRWSNLPPIDPAAAAAQVEETIENDEHLVEDLGRSEIIGLTQGRDLSILPASETVLLADPDCEGLFYKRHAEGTLSNLEYITLADRLRHYETRHAVAPPPPALEQGPVIICTDSSGSMTGLPERVAKALSLALVRNCLASGRSCYLIAFSSDIQCIDLSNPVASLSELLAFMGHSFRGGTDLRPALYRSLELLDNPQWINADLLIISDFRVPKLMIKKSGLIEPIRSRHRARLHALSIASSPPIDDLHIFDSHWYFRTGLQGQAQGISPAQFREI